MPIRSYADVPNRIVRLFLQEAGARYDENRGFKPYRRLTNDLLARFDHACAYCGADGPLIEEHIVPMNQRACGLHAWGNTVPACRACNNAKKDLPWETHVGTLSTTARSTTSRVERVTAYIEDYRYRPDVARLRDVVVKLYRLADLQTRGLLEFGLVATDPYLRALSDGSGDSPPSLDR